MNNVERKLFIEPERYEFTAASIHQFELARRDFFKILGAGIAVFAVAKDAPAAQETAPGHRSFHNEDLPKDISAWLHVGEDGGVTGFTGKAEIGQNIRTELAQTIERVKARSEELRKPAVAPAAREAYRLKRFALAEVSETSPVKMEG